MGCCPSKRKKHADESTNRLLEDSTCVSDQSYIIIEELPNELLKQLLPRLPRDFYQLAYEDILKMHEHSRYLPELILQGSASDGFLINGYTIKSDIDFLYSMNIFSPSLKFQKIINDPRSPAYVNIEVISNLSECKTKLENDQVMSNIEHKDGHYVLNINHIKSEIYEQIGKRLELSDEYKYIVKSDKSSCFRIEFNYDFYKVVTNHLRDQILQLTEFSESILKTTELKEEITKLFYNLSGNYLVNQYEWENVQKTLKLHFHTENVPSSNYKFSSNNETLQQEIINILNFYFNEINTKMVGILKWNLRHWKCFNIIEYSFYFLLLILITFGLDTIIEVISHKTIFFENQNINDVQEKINNYDRVYFTEEEITKIINVDLVSGLNDAMTPQQKKIEKTFHDFLLTNTNEIKTQIEDWKMLHEVEEFPFFPRENYIDGKSSNKLSWLSSMIKLLVHFLENYKYFWISSFNHSLRHYQPIEIVPGLKFNDWPLVASAWATRERYWPEKETVERMMNTGYHVVFKSLNENNGYDGRLSFSEAETVLSHAMTHDQIIVYNFIKFQLRTAEIKQLKSYYIKTICFWVFESTQILTNSITMQETYLRTIIKTLCIALKEQFLPHYFIPQQNIFINFSDEDFKEICDCLWKINVESCRHELLFMDHVIMNHETNVNNCFKLVENLFVKTIDKTFKNIISDLK